MKHLVLTCVAAMATLGCDAETDGGGQPTDPIVDPDDLDQEDDLDHEGHDAQDAEDREHDEDRTREEGEDDDAVAPVDEDDEQARDAEVEPNDDPDHPTFIGSPSCSAEAALEGRDDVDWFSVRIVAPGEVVFVTSTADPADETATDTRLELYSTADPARPLAVDDDSGEGSASRLSIALEPGLVLVKVFGYTTATNGPYTISALLPGTEPSAEEPEDPEITLGPAQEVESESNGVVGAADSMGTAPSSIAAILDARDVDWFAFQVDGPMSLTIETRPTEEGADSTDTVVELFDRDGLVSLGGDDDGSDIALFSRLSVDLPAAGLYTVRVSGYGESTNGAYTLSIE